MTATDVERLEAGLAASWVRQVRWSPAGEVHHVGGLLVALSGVSDQTQQVAVVEASVDEPEAAVVAAEVLFGRAGWNPAFDLVDGVHPALEEVLVDRGYRVVVERPGLILRESDPVPDLTASVPVRVARPADRGAVVGVQAEAFGLSRRMAATMLPEAAFADVGVEILVACGPRGSVIGSVATHVDGDVAGIVGAGVLTRHRHRGAGTALTFAALESAARRGAGSVWLQSSPEGLGVYRRAGFRDVGSCRVWLHSGAG